MFNLKRYKVGNWLVVSVVIVIGFAFIVPNLLSPRATTQGLHSGAVAATVNGEDISVHEFLQHYQGMLNNFKKMYGDKLSDDQLKMFGLKKMALQHLIRKKVLLQAANRSNYTPSPLEIAEIIKNQDVFKKNGEFDVTAYHQLLTMNHLSPYRYERMIYEDLAPKKLQDYFESLVYVSPTDAKKNFIAENDRAELEYVVFSHKQNWINPEPLKPTSSSLGNLEGLEDVPSVTDADTTPETPEALEQKQKEKEKAKEEQHQAREKVIETALQLLKDKNKKKPLAAFLKKYFLTQETTGWINHTTKTIHNINSPQEIIKAAFSRSSPLVLHGDPHVLTSPKQTVIVRLVKREQPVMETFQSTLQARIFRLQKEKASNAFYEWSSELVKSAKVDTNAELLQE